MAKKEISKRTVKTVPAKHYQGALTFKINVTSKAGYDNKSQVEKIIHDTIRNAFVDTVNIIELNKVKMVNNKLKKLKSKK